MSEKKCPLSPPLWLIPRRRRQSGAFPAPVNEDRHDDGSFPGNLNEYRDLSLGAPKKVPPFSRKMKDLQPLRKRIFCCSTTNTNHGSENTITFFDDDEEDDELPLLEWAEFGSERWSDEWSVDNGY